VKRQKETLAKQLPKIKKRTVKNEKAWGQVCIHAFCLVHKSKFFIKKAPVAGQIYFKAVNRNNIYK
jgi:hypothetical protein